MVINDFDILNASTGNKFSPFIGIPPT